MPVRKTKKKKKKPLNLTGPEGRLQGKDLLLQNKHWQNTE